MASVDEPVRPDGHVRDAARTKAEILDVATREFARAGYDGARVDEIAARTRTTKRMIYYYFGGKEQLFTAVLERAYGVILGPSGGWTWSTWTRPPRSGASPS
jgi:AcrR family transcriptional regulator